MIIIESHVYHSWITIITSNLQRTVLTFQGLNYPTLILAQFLIQLAPCFREAPLHQNQPFLYMLP